MRILVKCTGFIGDILFASSLAKKLKEKYIGCHVTYLIPLIQPRELLEQNPFIDVVLLEPIGLFDMEINIPVINPQYPATVQIQAAAGIEDQSLEFDVYTVPQYDSLAHMQLNHHRYGVRYTSPSPYKKLIAYQTDWAWKAYQCTIETLVQGIGAPHRNTDTIIETLAKDFIMVQVGFDRSVSQVDPRAADSQKYAMTASYIKACDFFIGSEGGLSNLAAAVGTRCIITTDYIEQNYGPNGRVRRCDPPMMGPATYYPNTGHFHLDPCITDEEIPLEIKRIVNGIV